MKAIAVFPRTRNVKLIDVAEPRITQPTQVKLRILEVGIGDVDASICAFQHGTPPTEEDYLIIGHAALANVVEVGTRVSNLLPGDLVVTMLRRPCSHPDCRPCRSGHPDFCISGGYAACGIKDRHGFLTEFAVEDEKYLQVVPNALREVAVLVEPLTVAEKALSQGWHVLQRLPWMANGRVSEGTARGLRALVIGTGTTLVLGAMPLLRTGFETYAYSPVPMTSTTVRMLEVFGARPISCHPSAASDVDALQGKIDVIYDAGGEPPDPATFLKLLAPNGIYLLGGHSAGADPFSDRDNWRTNDMVVNNQFALGVVSAGKNGYSAAVCDLDSFAERWPKEVRSLIARRYPIDDFREPLLGEASSAKVGRNVIAFHRTAAA